MMSPRLDQNDAPPGYFAVLKSEAKPADGSNICRACNWRQDCSGEKYRCMPYAITTTDGRTLKRADGCSVVFKRLPSNAAHEPKAMTSYPS